MADRHSSLPTADQTVNPTPQSNRPDPSATSQNHRSMQRYTGAAVQGQPPQPYRAPKGTIPPHGFPRSASPSMQRACSAISIRPPWPPVKWGQGPSKPLGFKPAVCPNAPPPKPPTRVFVSEIATTVENDIMHSLLELCGPVKNWQRFQDPTTGMPVGYGYCEFESAEGVLRALRLLCKLNVGGQELMIELDAEAKEYLELFVEKKTESSKKLKETESEGVVKKEETNDTASFGIVTDEETEADRKALEKLTGMIEERLKNRPLPLPPPLLAAADEPARSRDGIKGWGL